MHPLTAAWLCLFVAGLFEIGWPVGLKISQSPGRSVLGITVAVIGMGISGWLLWLARWRARWIVRSLYLFFRNATGLSASHLIPAEDFLVPRGFTLRERLISEWGLLHSDWLTRAGA